jgi:hypothetical protein
MEKQGSRSVCSERLQEQKRNPEYAILNFMLSVSKHIWQFLSALSSRAAFSRECLEGSEFEEIVAGRPCPYCIGRKKN